MGPGIGRGDGTMTTGLGTIREAGLRMAKLRRPLEQADLGVEQADPVEVVCGRVGPGMECTARDRVVVYERDDRAPGRWLVYLGGLRVVSMDDRGARKYLFSLRDPGGRICRSVRPKYLAEREAYRRAEADVARGRRRLVAEVIEG
jgi:hypothetical protein